MIGLPDINVLLALAWSHHAHHEAAHAWFSHDVASGWATCLLTQTGFVRLSMNPQIVGVSLDGQGAINLLQSLVEHPQHQYAEMAPPLTGASFDELVVRLVGYRQVPDATLLYLARVHEMKLVTFDQAINSICPWPEHLELLVP